MAGPRRLRYGGVRDQILGVQVALADGTIARGGGKVVKNVAGYDLPKLFTGALGTLGVVLSASFRLYPLPADSRTLLCAAPQPEPLFEAVRSVAASTLTPVAIDVLGPDGERQPLSPGGALPVAGGTLRRRTDRDAADTARHAGAMALRC